MQHDCGGFRLVRKHEVAGLSGLAYVYPSGGICPTATKRECMIFLAGCAWAYGYNPHRRV